MAGGDHSVELVRGQLTPERTTDLLRFWSSHGVLAGDAAERRLPDVAALLVDRADIVIGSCSARAVDVALVGGRRFWVYDQAITTDVGVGPRDDLFNTTFAALDDDHVPGGDGPIGMCVLVDDPVVLRSRREAVWPGTDLFFAGYDTGGRQVRLRYFTDAEHLPNPDPGRPRLGGVDYDALFPLPDGYQLHEHPDAPIAAGDIVALWRADGGLTAPEARRRLDEVELVATGPDGSLAGVSTAYVHHDGQLGAPLWAFRMLVAEPHRRSNIGAVLYRRTTGRLRARHAAGTDRRADGQLIEVEHEGLRRMFPQAVGPFAPVRYVGDRADGAPRYVEWFDGALAPLPPP